MSSYAQTLKRQLICLIRQMADNPEQFSMILKKGTIVDSTIISAPSSTKNKEKQRDPDAHCIQR